MTTAGLVDLLKQLRNSDFQQTVSDLHAKKFVDSLDQLTIALIAYRYLFPLSLADDKGSKTASNSELAKFIKKRAEIDSLTGSYVSRAISRSQKLFLRDETMLLEMKGDKYHPLTNFQAQNAAANLEHLLLTFVNQLGLRCKPVYHVGVGDSLTSYHAWLATRPLKRDSSRHLDILILNGSPRDLLKRGEQGEFDIVVTSITAADIEHDEKLKKVTTKDFPLRLMFDRRESLPDYEHLDVDDEKRWQLLLQNRRLILVEARDPKTLDYRKKLPPTCQVEYSDSWNSAFASVLSSKNFCCIACPDVLPARHRTRFREIELPDLDALKVGVITYARQDPWAPTAQQVEELADVYQDHLQSMVRRTPHFDTVLDKRLTKTAHLTYGPAGKQGEFPSKSWVKGTITNFVVTTDGRLRGDHKIESGNPIELSFEGNITEDKRSGTAVFHVTWRAWQRGMGGPECLVVCFAVTRDEAQSGAIVGVVSGRSTWSPGHRQIYGLFILYDATKEWDDDDFNRRANVWRTQYEQDGDAPIGDLLVPPELDSTATIEKKAEEKEAD